MIAVDFDDEKLKFARQLVAEKTLNGCKVADIPEAIMDISKGGAQASLDALGAQITCHNSIMCLRPRGKHIQVGLMLGDHAAPQLSMSRVIAKKLEILGSHGMQAHRYGAMLDMIASGKINPQLLVGEKMSLDDAPAVLMNMNKFPSVVITRF